MSFREACRFLTNYTCGHETPCGLLEYPDQHIEVNLHLREVIPHLVAKYPDALWVHLVRQQEPCVESLARLEGGDYVRNYARLFYTIVPSNQPADIAYRYYWAVNDNVRVLLTALVHRHNRLTFPLEDVKENWRKFWDWIGGVGDFEGSLASWDVRRNTTEEREGRS